jgi:DNA-directed RNA polymerase subunit RPC12/RpoP
MAQNPNGYERAVGVVETEMKCTSSDCGRFFRAANEHDTNCPYCGSSSTRKLRDSKKKPS